MKQINRLTSLLNEILSKHYTTKCEDNIIMRMMQNIKRYELVYYLFITMIQMIFLLMDRELLVPALIMMFTPITTIILNPYVKGMFFIWSLYPLLVMLAFVFSVMNETVVLFSIDVLVSFVLIISHSVTFDSRSFEDEC